MSEELMWVRWGESRPTDTTAVYWWRVPAREYGGIVCQPRWAEKLHERWTLGDKKEFFPPYTHWNGYRNTPLKGLEWAVATEDNNELVVWDGIDVFPCPFCGSATVVSGTAISDGGGIWCNAAPYLSNNFHFECSGCGIPTLRGRDLSKMLKFWNARTALTTAPDHIGDVTEMVAPAKPHYADLSPEPWGGPDGEDE